MSQSHGNHCFSICLNQVLSSWGTNHFDIIACLWMPLAHALPPGPPQDPREALEY